MVRNFLVCLTIFLGLQPAFGDVEHKPLEEDRLVCSFDENFCIPFFGCLEKIGEFYSGHSLGRCTWPIFARSSSGITCEGWWWRNVLGLGCAKFSCEDGTTGTATYSYFDSKSGIATGSGRTDKRELLRLWAGHNVQKYLSVQEEEAKKIASCVADGLNASGL